MGQDVGERARQMGFHVGVHSTAMRSAPIPRPGGTVQAGFAVIARMRTARIATNRFTTPLDSLFARLKPWRDYLIAQMKDA